MNKVWVISDTHFGHKNIIGFESEHRPYATIQEHDADLVARWNAVVRPGDTVWHLGDVYFGRDTHEILGSLVGLKHLVLGNHDCYPIEIYQKYFKRICGAREHSGALLTHVPVHPNQLTRYGRNIHGHMHSNRVLVEYNSPAMIHADPRYRCVSVEHTNLAPILMAEALA